MPRGTQLNLNVKNETGTLARLCRDLANGGVNVLALSAPEADRGGMRVLVANRELAEYALTKAGYSFSVEEVLFLELKNRPGALAKAAEKLARAKIDVKYAYVTAYRDAKKTAAVIGISKESLPRALELLG